MRKNNEFFVGYLKAPQSIVSFYKIVVPIFLLIAIAVGVWLSLNQQSAGKGVAELSNQSTMSGYLTLDPYPVLHHVGEEKRSVILVDRFKKSANDLLQPYANQWITVSGLPIDRGDWVMLQVPADAEVQVVSNKMGLEVSDQYLGEVTFEGEIIDSKCFLGVMKPGGGKVHRACARLCLLGGVPPMLAVKNQQGERLGYLLMNEDGSSASIPLSDKVAVPVRLSGTLLQRGELQYVRLNASNVKLLTGSKLADYGETLAQMSDEDVAMLNHDHNH
jgi:hypothetical protein